MDNRIAEFLKSLEEKLSDLPENERKNVIQYYEEFLYDASDASDSDKNLDEVLKQLGDPKDIAAMVKAEESFNQAEKKPGLRNFNKAAKNAFLGVSTPVGYFIRGLFLVVVYGALVVFLGGALVSALGAITGFSALLYETFKIPSQFFAERLGTLGMAFLVLSLLFIIAFVFFIISRWLIRVASQVIKNMLRKKAHKDAYAASGEERKKGRGKLVFGISLAVMTAGLILAFASGLPVKLFNIFNSAKPENIKVTVSEYNAADVSNISIITAHSCIKVVNDNAKPDKVVISYEQPDWMAGQSSIDNGAVTFKEVSNGRIPLFDLVSLHESRTEVTLHLPEGYKAENIQLESKGGFVAIEDVDQNINAKTYTGRIDLLVSESGIPYNINAKTEVGVLDVKSVYPDAKNYPEITINQQNAARTFDLKSNSGNITVK